MLFFPHVQYTTRLYSFCKLWYMLCCDSNSVYRYAFICVRYAAEMSLRFIRAKPILSPHWDFHQHLSRKMESVQIDQQTYTQKRTEKHTHTQIQLSFLPSLLPLHLSRSQWFTKRASMLLCVSLFRVSTVSKGTLLSYMSVSKREAPASCPCDVCVVTECDGDWLWCAWLISHHAASLV